MGLYRRYNEAMLSGPMESALRTWSRIAPTGRGSYRLVRAVRKHIPRPQWQRRFTLPSGIQMDLDLAIYPDCCMAYGLYELTTVKLVRSLLRPGDHFIDGGANIGYFTLLAAQLVGPTGKIDSFEPEPHNRQRLLDHLAINKLSDRVTVHDCALFDAEGEAAIHFYPPGESDRNHGCSTLFADPGVHTEPTQVRTARMDQVLRGTTPRLIKLDLEGAEAPAIAGAEGLLTGPTPPVLIGERNPRKISDGPAPDDWVRRAMSIQPGYRLYVVGRRLDPVPDADHLPPGGELNLLLRTE